MGPPDVGTSRLAALFRAGWTRFPRDRSVREWLAQAGPAALAASRDPDNAHWLRCEGTWFVGVNALASGPDGSLTGAAPLAGHMAEFANTLPGVRGFCWDPGQVSVIYPGYPKPKEGESETAFRYRRDRDAAHVDGLTLGGPGGRRRLGEAHAFIAGLPVTATGAGASPLVVWEGSHEVMRRALGAVLRPHPVEAWPEVDLTEAYHAARREVFQVCRRVAIHAQPGEAYLIHRLALHGVAPWEDGAVAPEEGRVIVYFRPELPGPMSGWLEAP